MYGRAGRAMIGQLIDGRYQIIRNLDAGRFAKTFIAEDSRRPGRPQCVVKRLQPSQSDRRLPKSRSALPPSQSQGWL
jgi:hypothetical protein